ncbi:MAG: hypothetical protein HZA54_14270 [Planctomycetes bacterium]|nr:hypothetical protein [Planctomycetota bacterium]
MGQAGRGDPVWVHVNGEGGPRVSLGFPIPIATGLTVSAGFSAGANLRYSITSPDPKELSTRILDSAEEAFDLPLSAARADELVPGETYALEGNSTVSRSESLGVGRGLGGIGGVVRVEASAGEHATVSIRGAFKFAVQRLDGQRVRGGRIAASCAAPTAIPGWSGRSGSGAPGLGARSGRGTRRCGRPTRASSRRRRRTRRVGRRRKGG